MKRCFFSFTSVLLTLLAFLTFTPLAGAQGDEGERQEGLRTFEALVKRSDFDNRYITYLPFSSGDMAINMPIGLFVSGYFALDPNTYAPIDRGKMVGCATQVKVTGRGALNTKNGSLKFGHTLLSLLAL